MADDNNNNDDIIRRIDEIMEMDNEGPNGMQGAALNELPNQIMDMNINNDDNRENAANNAGNQNPNPQNVLPPDPNNENQPIIGNNIGNQQIRANLNAHDQQGLSIINNGNQHFRFNAAHQPIQPAHQNQPIPLAHQNQPIPLAHQNQHVPAYQRIPPAHQNQPIPPAHQNQLIAPAANLNNQGTTGKSKRGTRAGTRKNFYQPSIPYYQRQQHAAVASIIWQLANINQPSFHGAYGSGGYNNQQSPGIYNEEAGGYNNQQYNNGVYNQQGDYNNGVYNQQGGFNNRGYNQQGGYINYGQENVPHNYQNQNYRVNPVQNPENRVQHQDQNNHDQVDRNQENNDQDPNGQGNLHNHYVI